MSKHTPGPWTTKFRRHVNFEENSHIHLLTDKEGFNIGLLSSWVNDPETKLEAKANALLIAAAPDLLEALEELLLAWDECQNPRDGVAEHARSAIARAKGEHQ